MDPAVQIHGSIGFGVQVPRARSKLTPFPHTVLGAKTTTKSGVRARQPRQRVHHAGREATAAPEGGTQSAHRVVY